jgi:branched-chain amino acid transport system permease protein
LENLNKMTVAMSAPVLHGGESNRSGRRIARWLAWSALAVALLVWPMFYENRFVLTMATLVALSAIGVTSLNLIIRTGHVSLAHAAFMGVAAYTCVLTQMRLGLSFPVALVLGCFASGLLALILGPIVLRLTGKYFVLVTFLLGEIIRMVFVEWQSMTGGSNGIQGLPSIHKAFDTPIGFYYLALFAAVVCVGIVLRILSSEIGRAIDSMREAERIAECSGVPVIRLKVTVFVIACVLVGVQGALQVHFLKFIDPSAFNMEASLNMVVMNVIGGMYHLAGPLLGTVFMTSLPELLRGYVELQKVIFGIILIVVMAALPTGMVGAIAAVRRVIANIAARRKQ